MLNEVSTVEEGKQSFLHLRSSWLGMTFYFSPAEDDLMAIDDKFVEAGKTSPSVFF